MPEPAAASFRLDAVERALAEGGTSVTALTTTYPPVAADDPPGVDVRRLPALRAKDGYLRGYLPYLSFDIPLFFRLLLSSRPDVILVEPPPTTGAVVRVVAGLRRIPYVWYAADIWSDATAIAGSPRAVVCALRGLERFAIRGASRVLAVSEGVAERTRALGSCDTRVVPNGIDTDVYSVDVLPPGADELRALGITGQYVMYAGTASEWQGATVFAHAWRDIRRTHPDAQVVFIGQGTDWEKLDRLSRESGGAVVLLPHTDPGSVARLLAGARAALVSIVPGRGYDFAYPTKVLAALGTGTPVIFAGVGPVADDIATYQLGWVVSHSVAGVAGAMNEALAAPDSPTERLRRAQWVRTHRSVRATGLAAAENIIAAGRTKQ